MARKRLIPILTHSKLKFLIFGSILVVLAFAVTSLIFAVQGNNPLKNKSIIVDPGHGGIDGGTNDGSTFLEKDINLQISLLLKDLLENNGANPKMTRDSDIALDGGAPLNAGRHKKDLQNRVSQFNSGKYDVFLSVHVNRSPNSNTTGPIVLYSPYNPKSKLLASCLQNRFNEHIRLQFGKNIVRKPVKSSGLFILSNAKIPGVIIEAGFISNSRDKELLRQKEYQLKIAKTICDGIKDYYKEVQDDESHDTEDIRSPKDSIPFNTFKEARLVLR